MNLIVVGAPGSGKTSLRQYFEASGWNGYEASEYIRAAQHQFDARSVKELVQKAGPGMAARMIWEDMSRRSLRDNTIVSGFRSPLEVDYIRRRNSAIVVGLSADMNTRFERVMRRSRPGENQTYLSFKQRVVADYELGLANVMLDESDIHIFTDGLTTIHVAERVLRLAADFAPRKWRTALSEVVPPGSHLDIFPDRIAVARTPRI